MSRTGQSIGLKLTASFSPRRRITVEGLLAHPYLSVRLHSKANKADNQAYHDPTDEPVAAPLKRNFFDFEDYKENLPKEMLKRKLH